MAAELAEILEKALRLPVEARAALAGSLLESLDHAGDASVEEAWSLEIARRIEELDIGRAKTVAWTEARHQMLSLLNETSRSSSTLPPS